MDRRVFLWRSLWVLLAAPAVGEARPAPKVNRIGWLTPSPGRQHDSFVGMFVEGLRERGWVEGQHFAIEIRGADRKPERFPELAADLVRAAGGPTHLDGDERLTRVGRYARGLASQRNP